MICHIVMFKFKEFAEGRSKAEKPGRSQSVCWRLREKSTRLSAWRSSSARLVLRIQTTIISLSLRFRSMEEMLRYQKHPSHVASAILSRPCGEPDGRASIDYKLKE